MPESFSHDLSFFRNTAQAETNLKSITNQTQPHDIRFLKRLLDELRPYPNCDDIFNLFERLSRAVIDRIAFFKMLSGTPPTTARLVRLFASSPFIAELMIRDFQYAYFLVRPEYDCRPFDKLEVQQHILRLFHNQTPSLNRVMDALRKIKRREMLKLGIRDYILQDPLEKTVASVSDLAECVLQGALDAQRRDMAPRWGNPETPFCVIALGKFGGGELNYSSDIDVMFVYEEENEYIVNEHRLTHHEYFNRLASGLIAHIAKNTSEGQLYRVDARLRPDGDAGPLARCVSSFLYYYEARGQTWERQMLIKARPVAGDLEFGARFIKRLEPFVYPKTFFQSPLHEVAAMKWRIEEQKSSDHLNIKICPGGIRDIEFIVQALQLIHGGQMTEIRTGNTLKGLKQLFSQKLLSPNEFQTLSSAYIFYRKIEHILQIEKDTQKHTLSGTTDEFTKIAILLGYTNGSTLESVLNENLKSVRAIYLSVFEIDNRATSVFSGLISEVCSEEGIRFLQEHHFTDPDRTHRTIRLLAMGQFPKLYGNSVRECLAELLEILLTDVGQTHDPDSTLAHLERIVAAQPFAEMLYRSLSHNAEYRKHLVYLCSLAPGLTQIFCERPSYLDWLQIQLPTWLSTPHQGAQAIYRLTKNLQHIRRLGWVQCALTNRNQPTSSSEPYLYLSKLADHILQTAFSKVLLMEDPIILLGMGKLGGSELSYRSDLDVVWVCSDDADVDHFISQARRVHQRITDHASEGKIYDMDARLRPEGAQAPLVVTLSRYKEYFSSRAMFWEVQSLIKARCIAGSSDLHSQFESWRYEQLRAASKKWNIRQEITSMRERQIREKIKAPADAVYEIKTCRGGLLDIEYLVQGLQLLHGDRLPQSPVQSTVQTINSFTSAGLLLADDASILTTNYYLLRRIEEAAFLLFERKSSRLPSDEKQLAFIANFLEFETRDAFLMRLEQIKESNHRLFLHYLGV